MTVIVSFRVRPAALEEVVGEIAENARESLAEPGCLEFTVLRDASDELEFVLYERYRDESAFRDDHMRTPHYDRWSSVVSRCVEPDSRHRRELRAVVTG